MDVYIQPHSDDICFSLGVLAHMRHSGVLLTVFPISGYVATPPGAVRPSPESVTRARIEEDRAFSEACGLNMHMLDIPCSSLLGYQPFDLSRVDENFRRVEVPLLEASLALAAQGDTHTRPWLFCPSGIGGHVDHVAVRMVVTKNYKQLSQHYRIWFYEDLHYASDPKARSVGINSLLQAMSNRVLHRIAFPLTKDDVTKKLALIRHYRSQFLITPKSIAQFTPAVGSPSAPHEAIWTDVTD